MTEAYLYMLTRLADPDGDIQYIGWCSDPIRRLDEKNRAIEKTRARRQRKRRKHLSDADAKEEEGGDVSDLRWEIAVVIGPIERDMELYSRLDDLVKTWRKAGNSSIERLRKGYQIAKACHLKRFWVRDETIKRWKKAVRKT